MAVTPGRRPERADSLSAEARAEIRGLIAALPEGLSYVATGSLVEGLGNASSDIDLYAIADGRVPGPGVRMGMRETHYVDVEFMTVRSLNELSDLVNGATWRNVDELRLRDVDRYYRLAIAIPMSIAGDGAAALEQFDKETACRVFSQLATLRGYEHWCLAGLILRTGPSRDASLLLREAWLWHAAAVLAGDGEGYPSLKWTAAKAARRYGRSSRRFTELVAGFTEQIRDPEVRWTEMRGALTPPRELLDQLQQRSCRLTDGTQLFGNPTDHYLRNARGSIVCLQPTVAAVCQNLLTGRSWHAAAAEVGEALGLGEAEARVALWLETHDLRIHEFLAATAGVGAAAAS